VDNRSRGCHKINAEAQLLIYSLSQKILYP